MAIRLRAAIGKDRIESAAALYSTVHGDSVHRSYTTVRALSPGGDKVGAGILDCIRSKDSLMWLLDLIVGEKL